MELNEAGPGAPRAGPLSPRAAHCALTDGPSTDSGD